MLHLKGAAVAYRGKAFLFLGRGGSGKTEVVQALCRNGARLVANTHLLVDGRYHKGTCFEPLMSADIVPPFLTEVYATGSDSRWPVRLFEIRWERRDPRRS